MTAAHRGALIKPMYYCKLIFSALIFFVIKKFDV
jgi:hypothetical protein